MDYNSWNYSQFHLKCLNLEEINIEILQGSMLFAIGGHFL